MTNRLRLATFNLENLDDESRGTDFSGRLRLLRPQLQRIRADVLCLQEVNGQNVASDKPRVLRALDRLLDESPYADYHRVVTLNAKGEGPRDRHNLVIVSRFPIVEHAQLQNDLIEPPRYRPATARPRDPRAQPVTWDRPCLHGVIALDGRYNCHVVNLHLKAPRAVLVAGHKHRGGRWDNMSAWAEGYFLAAVKRAGQALEARLLIDRLIDREPDAKIAVVGDYNATENEVPLRLLQGDEEYAGNPDLACRRLVALERGAPQSRRFSVIHGGRPSLVDHILVSQALLGWFRHLEIHNEFLGDELATPLAVPGALESFHAPLVAEFALPEAA